MSGVRYLLVEDVPLVEFRYLWVEDVFFLEFRYLWVEDVPLVEFRYLWVEDVPLCGVYIPLGRGCTFGGVQVPCVYSCAR